MNEQSAFDPGSGRPSAQGSESFQPTAQRVKQLVFGRRRDLNDRTLFHKMSLVPFLAWVGLGADGLSSSAYGPEEAFRALGEHTCLAVVLAVMMGVTVLVIATAYSHIIEHFPHGGGGYVVSTKLLGRRSGLVSGSALLVDYILTITISVSAAGDALFSFLPESGHAWKLLVELGLILGLTTLNIRGVKESVLVLTPIFLVFLVTHALLIGGGLITHAGALPTVAREVGSGFRTGVSALGWGGMLMLLLHAYSFGGGTYTGLEAVSNGLPIMRAPRAQTARRTMLYMGISLAATVSGLLICYLLYAVEPVPGRTLNAELASKLAAEWPGGRTFALVTILSEGALLVVAAQAGFIDGPRILANMAVDSWVPRRFASLSERLTTRNGVLLMCSASLVALLYTRGEVRHLVVMYSINVFLTFSLSMFAMLRYWIQVPDRSGLRRRRIALFGAGFLMCALILLITVHEKFFVGGWVTLAVTGICVGICLLVQAHYTSISARTAQVDRQLKKLDNLATGPFNADPLDPAAPTAVILTGSYSGLGIHTILKIHRTFAGYFRNLRFVSIGVIDSGAFKGESEVDALRASTEQDLQQYVQLARRLGFRADYRLAIGTEVVEEAVRICQEVARDIPGAVFFTGQVLFRTERWYHRPLHNQTAFAIQRRLQWLGLPIVILPIRVE